MKTSSKSYELLNRLTDISSSAFLSFSSSGRSRRQQVHHSWGCPGAKTRTWGLRPPGTSRALGDGISRDPIGEKGGVNLYAITGNDEVNFVDTDGRSRWGGFKNNVLYPVGGFLKNNWGKLSGIASTACLVGPLYKCAKMWGAADAGASAYKQRVNQLNEKYGDPSEWPSDIVLIMDQWKSINIELARQAAKACGAVGGTSVTGGPIIGPGKL